jgi:hypothetical protein
MKDDNKKTDSGGFSNKALRVASVVQWILFICAIIVMVILYFFFDNIHIM